MEAIYIFLESLGVGREFTVRLLQVFAGLAVILAYKVYRIFFKKEEKTPIMEHVKENIFTVHGVVTSFFHVCIAIGFTLFVAAAVFVACRGYDEISKFPAKTTQAKKP